MDKLIVALDTKSLGEAYTLFDILRPETNFFKVGHTLIHKNGISQLIKDIKNSNGYIFYDIKLYDIPSTVKNCIKALSDLNIDFVSLLGDKSVMDAANEELEILNSKLGTLALRHLSTNEMEIPFNNSNAYCSGVIIPGALPSATKNWYRRMYTAPLIFSPGIRLDIHDNPHSWVCTPKQAIEFGSDFVIVGRPIIEAKNPINAIKEYKKSIEEGLLKRAAFP